MDWARNRYVDRTSRISRGSHMERKDKSLQQRRSAILLWRESEEMIDTEDLAVNHGGATDTGNIIRQYERVTVTNDTPSSLTLRLVAVAITNVYRGTPMVRTNGVSWAPRVLMAYEMTEHMIWQ